MIVSKHFFATGGTSSGAMHVSYSNIPSPFTSYLSYLESCGSSGATLEFSSAR